MPTPWNRNALTALLKIEYPIVQGPFGGGFSTARLAAAVSNAGGLGSFGAHNLNGDAIVAKVREIRALTDRPFAINLWVSSEDPALAKVEEFEYRRIADAYRPYFERLGIAPPPFPAARKYGESFADQVEALLEAAPPVFSFVFGIPDERVLERCRSKGIVTVGAATTYDEAVAVERAGVDALVASGFEAGGHRPSFLRESEDSLLGLGALLSQIDGRVKLPVIAAGGLSDAKSLVAARLLGADGFQLGTAFLACEESGATPAHRDAIFAPRARHTTLSRHYSGRLARFIANEFIAEARAKGFPYLPYPGQNYLLAAMKKSSGEKGMIELTPLYAGQGAPNLRHRSATALIESLVAEIPEILGISPG